MHQSLKVRWLLAAALILPLASWAQLTNSESSWGAISGRVLFAADGRPAERVKVELRLLTGGWVATGFTGWGGQFEFGGLPSATYVVAVNELGYEPIQETVQLNLSSGFGLVLHLKRSNSAQPSQPGYVISARELSIPHKAREEFQKGLDRRAKNDATGSLTRFQRAVAKDPSFYEAYLQMGLVYMQLGQTADAEQAIAKAIELSGGHYADADFAMGVLLLDRKQYADAEKITRQGLALAANSWQGHYELGRALMGLNRLDEAEQSAQKSCSLKPDFPRVHLLLADIHYRQQAYPALLNDLNEYLKLDPNSETSAKARAVRDNVQRALSQPPSAAAATQSKP